MFHLSGDVSHEIAGLRILRMEVRPALPNLVGADAGLLLQATKTRPRQTPGVAGVHDNPQKPGMKKAETTLVRDVSVSVAPVRPLFRLSTSTRTPAKS